MILSDLNWNWAVFEKFHPRLYLCFNIYAEYIQHMNQSLHITWMNNGVLMWLNITFAQWLDAYVTATLHSVLSLSSFTRKVAKYIGVAPNLNTSAYKLQWSWISNTPQWELTGNFPPASNWKRYTLPSLREWGATAKERPSLVWSSPPYQWGSLSLRGLVTRRLS